MLSPNEYSLKDYINKSFSCECGKVHSAAIRYICIEDQALSSLLPFIKTCGFQKAFVLYDATTWSLTGAYISSLFQQEAKAYTSYVIDRAEPVPDEYTLGEILIRYDPSCDFILGVGSGTINDLSRFISYKLKLPYIIAATAPSMDGFASNVAPLIVNHMKTTYEAHSPLAIFGDTALLKNAPMNMISAGIGDILGKYTCLCDWEISSIITGEYYCNSVVDMVKHSLETVVSNIDSAKTRKPEAVKSIMEALVLSGIAMSFAGNSRPASGSEHHLSHYWEMMYLFQGRKPILHGTKVGIATIAVIKAYELLLSMKIDFKEAQINAGNFSKEKWETFMKEAYQNAAQPVIALENEVGKNDPANVIPRIRLLEKNWELLKKAAGRLPSADLLYAYLSKLGASCDPMSVGIDKSIFMNSFLAAKELRNRFGLLQIMYDLGLTKIIAKQVWDYFQQASASQKKL